METFRFVGGSLTASGGSFGSTQSLTVNVAPLPLLELDLKTDYYGGETTWYIRDCSGTVILTGSGYANQRDYSEAYALIGGTFIIRDSFGDGICCDYGNGSYTLKYGGQVIKTGGVFGSSESTIFGNCPTSSAKLLSPETIADLGEPAVNQNGKRMSVKEKERAFKSGAAGAKQKKASGDRCKEHGDCFKWCKGDGYCK